MSALIINTRADLDALKGSDDYLPAMRAIAGTMNTMTDVATYPDGYGQPDYAGEPVEPDWQTVENLTIVQRLGFATRADFETEYAATAAGTTS